MARNAARTVLTICLSFMTMTVARPSWATLSIVAVHPDTGELGGIVVSCSQGLFEAQEFSLSQVIVLHAGVGAVAAQSVYHEEGRDEIERLLVEGKDPRSAIDEVIDPKFDVDSASRQYAALSLSGAAVVHTGSDCPSIATHKVGQTNDGYTYTLQGNTMAQARLLDAMEAAFLEDSGPLPARLVRAMERLSAEGAGDTRCEPRTSDTGYFAWLPSNGGLIEVEISTGGDDRDAALVLVEQVRDQVPEVEPAATAPPSGEPRSRAASAGCSYVNVKGLPSSSPIALGLLLVVGILRFRRRTFIPNES